ncbi:MAG: AAA family ATPase [Desulfobacteraceae bacterium]|nr:AAA family ATPase [Desulfobacteraceae bacterium]
MKCPKCQYENPEGAKFCRDCGTSLEQDIVCPNCGSSHPPGSKFCIDCGHDLSRPKETPPTDDSEPKSPPEKPFPDDVRAPSGTIEGERKHVTALFSDISGYTSMSERLDPEEVKEITSRIFGEISRIVGKYDGFIEKFIGDAVMALFGVPKAHEDDPVRAIRVAKEIHDLVRAMSPELEGKIGRPLSMHTGINTGLVVTGEVDTGKGTHGVAGDTINVAARLSSLAGEDEIVVGPDTYHQAEGYFSFEALEPTNVKGKAEPIRIYKALSAKEQPSTTRRHHGLRAELIGRAVELAQIREAAQKLLEGKGAIFAICGETGTGKTRLVEEFKATLDFKDVQWLDGQAYAYSQNTPYFPLVDLFNRGFRIKEGDPPEEVKKKVESGVEPLVGKPDDIIPYLGSLYALNYPEVKEVSPELWKSRLFKGVKAILSGLAQRAPTVICLEDLHWADASFIDLLRSVLLEFRYPALFICVYRPNFSLFTSHQLNSLSAKYQEIQLQDLSLSDTQSMLESLLKSKTLPQELLRFIQENVGGNPFYLEEVINASIESGTLIHDNGAWSLSRPINQTDMPSTIHGIIAARLDHLENESKRILQEASVIGRVFLYEILKRCTQLKDQLDRHMTVLEHLDLVHTRSLQPDLEYVFKSALTQEVVYNGLLKKERQSIHERIALVMEQSFQDRLPEFYETLAYHFTRGRSVIKAVDYLVKSGEKSLERYSVEEAHQYFKQAFDILQAKTDKSDAEKVALIDMLNEWGYVHYYLGDIKEWIDIFTPHKELAESLEDKAKLGMFYAWLGIAYFMEGSPKVAYDYLTKALNLGEDCSDQKVIGYACTWLSWACTELALYDEAVDFGEKAQQIAKSFPADQYLYFKSLCGLGYKSCFTGDIQKTLDVGRSLLSHGEGHANSRSKVLGHFITSFGEFNTGDIPSMKKSGERSIEVSEDPLYIHFGRLMAGLACLISGDFQEAEEILLPSVDFGEKGSCGQLLLWAYIFLGPVLIAQGRMSQGMELLDKAQQMINESDRKGGEAFYEYIMGKIYSLTATGPKPSLANMAKNIGFIVKNVPVASRKTVDHFNRAIEVSKEIGAKGPLGLAYLDLGMFYKSKKETDQSRACLTEAIRIFEQNGAEIYLKQAKKALASLG